VKKQKTSAVSVPQSVSNAVPSVVSTKPNIARNVRRHVSSVPMNVERWQPDIFSFPEGFQRLAFLPRETTEKQPSLM